MRNESAVATPPGIRPSLVPEFNHIGIQTPDLENCESWYREFFGAERNWSLDTFSDLTRSRLPGIVRLVELAVGGMRFHLFERHGTDGTPPGGNAVQFQHVCLSVSTPEELPQWRDRWLELYRSGRHTFARDEQPTGIVTDEDGVQSMYVLDVDGLEYEFAYIPAGAA